MSVHIPPNKHVGLLFEPRSGSHVVRHFLAATCGYANLGEFFNNHLVPEQVHINEQTQEITRMYNPLIGLSYSGTAESIVDRTFTHLDQLTKMASLGTYGVFGALVDSYVDSSPQLTGLLGDHPDIQLMKLERADVLYSVISTVVCQKTNIWHAVTDRGAPTTPMPRNCDKSEISLELLLSFLKGYVARHDHIRVHCGTLPILYYEQFQFNVSNLNKLFTGIPRKIISTPYVKFAGNYKELITNLVEVEDCYEQFVNEHRDYFPQYFGDLPHVQIPACQGRQPRDLSFASVAV